MIAEDRICGCERSSAIGQRIDANVRMAQLNSELAMLVVIHKHGSPCMD